MNQVTKRYQAAAEKISAPIYLPNDAIALIKQTATAKFDESIEVVVRLGVDPRKSDQVVRGASQLPHGTGRKVRVAVITNQPEDQAKALDLGAKAAGFEELIEAMKGGELPYDVVIAAQETMPVVGKLGQVLGPKGLMPNPKVGTVTTNVIAALQSALKGQVMYRTDKSGQIHCAIGKASFDSQSIYDNIAHLMSDLIKAKPSSAKGRYIQAVHLASTMGPGCLIDHSEFV